jgi:hypothetical protein
MLTKRLFGLVLLSLAPFACSSADVPGDVGQVKHAIIGGSVGIRTSYCDDVEQCMVGGNAPACAIAYQEQAATEMMTVVDESRVTLTYVEDPVFLFGREGLAVKEPIILDSQTTTALGLPPGTMVQAQFAPLMEDADGNLTIELGVGTVTIPASEPETFEPPLAKVCCPAGGGAHVCSGCRGGNSSDNYAGSWCCTNSVHYKACLYE